MSSKSLQWEPIHSMQRDGHNVANSRFPQFHEGT